MIDRIQHYISRLEEAKSPENINRLIKEVESYLDGVYSPTFSWKHDSKNPWAQFENTVREEYDAKTNNYIPHDPDKLINNLKPKAMGFLKGLLDNDYVLIIDSDNLNTDQRNQINKLSNIYNKTCLDKIYGLSAVMIGAIMELIIKFYIENRYAPSEYQRWSMCPKKDGKKDIKYWELEQLSQALKTKILKSVSAKDIYDLDSMVTTIQKSRNIIHHNSSVMGDITDITKDEARHLAQKLNKIIEALNGLNETE